MPLGTLVLDDDKARVDAWLADVSRAAGDRESALLVLRRERRALEELKRMPLSYQGRLEPTRARLSATITELEERERMHAAKVPEFVALMEELPDANVARALVYRTVEGLTWQRCAAKVHMNRQHLERLFNKSMPDLAKLVPSRYRDGA